MADHPHSHHDHHGGMPHRFEHADEWAKEFDDPARDQWQMPDKVVAALALAPALIVADVGAGSGYFTVRLARAVPQGTVIAADIEPDMIRYLDERATREHLPNIRAVLGTADAPHLGSPGVREAARERAPPRRRAGDRRLQGRVRARAAEGHAARAGSDHRRPPRGRARRIPRSHRGARAIHRRRARALAHTRGSTSGISCSEAASTVAGSSVKSMMPTSISYAPCFTLRSPACG